MGPFWRSAPLALHLPAHGRGRALAPALRRLLRQPPGSWDLPELPGFGGPLEPEGTVAEAQGRAAALLGAERCWFGVNGASGLLQAALLALGPSGSRVLLPRNLHRSLLHGCVLGGIEPLLYDLPSDPLTGLWQPPQPERLERVLAAASDGGSPPAALVLVDPTYQGLVADLPALVALAHRAGLPVLVDQAHGGGEALGAGADLVVLSVQKSGTGLAQSAALLAQGDRVAPEAIERALLWLQTSSPSALLLASTAAALEHGASDAGRRQRHRAEARAARLRSRLEDLGLPLVANGDPLRLVLATAPLGINGLEADTWMLQRGAIAELPEPGALTFCLGLNPPRGLERRLPRLLQDLRRALGGQPLPSFTAPPLPLLAAPELPIGVAWRSPAEAVPLERAAGRVAAAPICPYPPGIPLLVPGERIDAARADWLQGQRRLWPGQIADTVSVVVGS
ncbi:aminotransferase class I/II-fold pyridoxal phosphate-dependent enzyme [Cyanobium gracile]|uniref:Aminotransferase class I/II-fold pyridoxal phosphate-dependent enzyme n=1 Tax=Cyanobium gracile UHCC 0281 TaxID=3110309 RepID=A0ABU5SUZ3_9CYAN|nr:aminotransferase class I/II-fold pyridoxal phosphate-dependent enzyme [Cyanobium gracile]MEA5442318.1 aminotransferase class I/II-fold pyridoxal phosphate-dependent enzyme [Cyanobium gracile UHCC 0281]